jgi:signal transduction histidine kinase
MDKILGYLNPVEHLGDKKYSFQFPAIVTLSCAVVLEIYAFLIARNPHSIDLAALLIFIGLIIYFSFREGIRGGFVTTALTIIYYLYIVVTRHYSDELLSSSINTIIVLTVLYFLMSVVIGWLKQTIDDLIDREANEKRRLETIIQQLPVGVILTDEKGQVTTSNKMIERILGREIPIGFKVDQNAPLVTANLVNSSGQPSVSPLHTSLTTGKNIRGEEFVIKKDNKKHTYVQVDTSLIKSRYGKVIAAAQIVSDVTSQKELEKRKDDFVNMASHELKTPLTSMKLYLDYLGNSLKKHGDTKAIRAYHSLKDQTGRLQKLVNDLLDVSRLQTGKLNFNKEQFRLDKLVEETAEWLQGTAKQKIVLAKLTNLNVSADRFRIYQVLTNLITNAMKYAPDDQKIIIRVEKINDRAVVSVKDFGIGVAKDQQKKIFDRLYQVSDDQTKTFPGFGMGLYISHEIITRHRGQIWVESEIGKGATFYFSLPLEK